MRPHYNFWLPNNSYRIKELITTKEKKSLQKKEKKTVSQLENLSFLYTIQSLHIKFPVYGVEVLFLKRNLMNVLSHILHLLLCSWTIYIFNYGKDVPAVWFLFPVGKGQL
jgi:hypothetical protein